MRFTITIFALLFISNLFAQSSSTDAPDYVLGEVAVRLNPNVSIQKVIADFNKSDFDFKIELKKTVVADWNLHSVNLLPKNTNVPAAAKILNQLSGVFAAFADRIVKPRTTEPNDPTFPSQWALEQIGLPEVWDVTTGGTTPDGHEIVIAVLDSGFDPNHADLKDNLWINKAEIANDGIDNDGNGLIDDINGWNYKGSQAEFTIAGHGTAVSGVAGARGDNASGISGVNWDIKLMLFEIFTFTSISESYHYALTQRELFEESDGKEGAYVVVTNGSWGTDGRCDSFPEFDLDYDLLGEKGILSVVATTNFSTNIDLIGDIPSSCESEYLITVANSNKVDGLQETGFGKESIDISAPGIDIPTLWVNDTERTEKGTSMSTPHVASSIALLYSLPCTKLAQSAKSNPAETAQAMKSFILNGVDKIASHETKTVSGGRLNVKGSMDLIDDWCRELLGDFEVTKIFPNPAISELTILYSTPDLETIPYNIFNSIGQHVGKGEIVPDPIEGGVSKIDISSLAAGSYYISLEKGEVTLTEQFVKI